MADPASACAASDDSCDSVGRLQIDPLGSTLFWVGNTKFVVVPIPTAISSALAAHANAKRLLPSAAMTAGRR